jgi:hypothetical protein
MIEEDDGLIIEIQPVGSALRVSVMDAKSLTEVVFQAPMNTPKSAIYALAQQKMRYVLRKKEQDS